MHRTERNITMYNILTLNKIAACGTDLLEKDKYAVSDSAAEYDAVLVRSASMHEMELPASLLAIARAGAGVNNIPIDKCSEQGIVVFNTPGANANAVKELVIAALLLTGRKIIPSTEWIKTLKGKGDEVSKLVEKGKSQFVGPEIMGKKLGVIGLGAIGALVANAAAALGMEVYGTDPFLSVNAALRLNPSVHVVASNDDIYKTCDFITLHAPATAETKGMINAENIAKMKDGVRILNFARGDLVNSKDIIDALTWCLQAYLTRLQAARWQHTLPTLLRTTLSALRALLRCLTWALPHPRARTTAQLWLARKSRHTLKTAIS